MDDIERCLLVKSEVFVYTLPPRQSARGYRAADWNLSDPNWTGRLRLMEKNKRVQLKLEDKSSGALFAACPIDTFPGPAIEAVTDSSRYFVIKIVNEADQKTAYIGIGFSDRSDSFDLNVALQDHFKLVKKEDEILQEDKNPGKPLLNLAFKDGETIKVNINVPKPDKPKTSRPVANMGILLPPPASSSSNASKSHTSERLVPPLSNPSTPVSASSSAQSDLLCDLSDLNLGNQPSSTNTSNNNIRPSGAGAASDATGDDLWGDFIGASSASAPAAKSSGNWVQF